MNDASHCCGVLKTLKIFKNKYGKFGEIFEMMYLEDSVGIEIDYDKKSFY